MARQIGTPSWNDLTRNYAQWRSMREKGETEEAKAKKDILGILDMRGEEESGGHKMLPTQRLKIGKKAVIGFRRQRRVSQQFQESAATQWLKDNGLLEECTVTETTTYLNEDAILSLNFSGRIPDSVMQTFYTEKETFALTLIEADEDDDESEED